ncbi:MAG: GNAT family N-acetyltransferase [Trueperaceae bacterium]
MIAALEHHAANALPSSVTEVMEGWRLRYSYGVTRRANSVLAEGHQGNIERKLEAVNAFYQRFNTKPRFQLCAASQPENLDTMLLSQGYTKIPGAKVQTIGLEDFNSSADIAKVQLFDKPNDAWFSVYRRVEKADPHKETVRRQMLQAVQAKTAFALLHLGNQPAAVGLGVFENGYTGIFNMATLEIFRGRGGASTILTALAHWGRLQGGHTLYLQVAEDNTAAQRVYEGLGFSTLYNYWYLVAPQ